MLAARLGHIAYDVSLAAAVLSSFLVTGCCLVVDCDRYLHMESSTAYSLEIVNDTSELARVDVAMADGTFLDVDLEHRGPEQRRSGSWSGILTLDMGERYRFRVSFLGGPDSDEDGHLVRYFGAMHFFVADSDVPYRTYKYPFSGCLPALCSDPDDDKAYAHFATRDGPPAFLFVESPDRPFYLERDQDDLDVGRVVITFVPVADPVDQESDEEIFAGE